MRRVVTVAGVVWGLLWASDARSGGFTEHFGTLTSTCGSEWLDQCEVGWTPVAADSTLDMCDDGNGEYGVGILGGSPPNGIKRVTYALEDDDGLVSWTARFAVLAGSGTFLARVKFKDSAGLTISTHTESLAVDTDPDTYWLQLGRAIPQDAAYVDLVIGVQGSMTVWVDELTFADENVAAATTQGECDAQASAVDVPRARAGRCGGRGDVLGWSCRPA